ncbi:MAG: hypothetical protein JOY59_09610 [Candidatus Eremiobacteraeota bacterium]|nr:hypothetical protein [Candidatus Eremiobacteraeota bacterium]
MPGALIAVAIAILPSVAGAFTLPAGTTIAGHIQQEINSKTAMEGQRFTMTTNSGSRIYGHLSEVARGNVGRKAHLKLNFDSIRFSDGGTAPINASLTAVAQQKNINYTQAAGQVLGGMIAGNIVGKAVGTNLGGLVGLAGGALLAKNTAYDIDIPAGASAQITLNSPLTSGHPQAR